MSQQILSAAADDAATTREWDVLLSAAEHDPTLKAGWSRLCAARDAQHGIALRAGDDFCAGVMAAIAASEVAPPKVVDLAAARAARQVAVPAAAAPATPARRRPRWLPLSAAAAAGVAAAVLLIGQPFQPAADIGSPIALADTAPATLLAQADSPAPAVPVAVEAAPELDPQSASAEALNAYWVEHSNTLAQRNVGGALTSARFAARTAAYRPDGN